MLISTLLSCLKTSCPALILILEFLIMVVIEYFVFFKIGPRELKLQSFKSMNIHNMFNITSNDFFYQMQSQV